MWRTHVPRLALIVFALALWLPSIGWGLPSRGTDRFLFGERTPWTGQQIVGLLGKSSGVANPSRGADVDADPILERSTPTELNDTDAKRAAIVQRYRLMSGQPDEFIQFKALAEMSQRRGLARLDPRLYQYGGLWIYPVGALVRTALAVGLIERPPAGVPAMEFYLDHPEAFGKFYIVARAYSVAWGIVALLAIHAIARRITGQAALGVMAAVAFALLPVVRTATHEAKPHLAGAALCLCAVLAAATHVETGRRRWMMLAGVLCGAATAMVVSMVLSLVLLPTMVFLRASERRRRVVPLPGTPVRGQGEGPGASSRSVADGRVTPGANSPSTGDSSRSPLSLPSSRRAGTRDIVGIARDALPPLIMALLVYATTNPFVLYNAIAQPALLRSNLGNSTAMYAVGGLWASGTRAFDIASAGASTGLVILAVLALIAVLSRTAGRARLRSPAAMLVLTVGMVACVQFVALAAGKPAEYARFALVPVAAAVTLICAAVADLSRRVKWLALLLCVGMLVPRSGWATATLAIAEGERLHDLLNARAQGQVLAVHWPPAPWSCPPVDLFETRIVLVDLRDEASRFPDRIVVYPNNLGSQIGATVDRESVDWRANRFAIGAP